MKKNILFGMGLFIVALFVLTFSLIQNSNSVKASVNIGNGYLSTTTTSVHASATVPKVFRGSGGGMIGSIVVASSSASRIRIYDNGLATSTATSTIIIDLPANATVGEYPLDRDILRGITADVFPGFNGFYVITYR